MSALVASSMLQACWVHMTSARAVQNIVSMGHDVGAPVPTAERVQSQMQELIESGRALMIVIRGIAAVLLACHPDEPILQHEVQLRYRLPCTCCAGRAHLDAGAIQLIMRQQAGLPPI